MFPLHHQQGSDITNDLQDIVSFPISIVVSVLPMLSTKLILKYACGFCVKWYETFASWLVETKLSRIGYIPSMHEHLDTIKIYKIKINLSFANPFKLDLSYHKFFAHLLYHKLNYPSLICNFFINNNCNNKYSLAKMYYCDGFKPLQINQYISLQE